MPRRPFTRSLLTTIAAAAAIVVVTGAVYTLYGPGFPSGGESDAGVGGAPPATVGDDAATTANRQGSSPAPSPFKIVGAGGDGGAREERSLGGDLPPADGGGGAVGAASDAGSPSSYAAPLDVAAVGGAGWTDADFWRDAARLRGDPDALALVIESFRAESDPDRLAKLASLLGEVGHPDLAAIGADMASSGNAASRDAGLALLQHAQPTNAAAREVLVGMLASESDPAVLKSVIDAVSVPGEGGAGTADASADVLVAQLVPLTRHDSPAVRRNGITVLSRWAADENVTPVLRAALVDVDEGVRSSAVYAFTDYPLVDGAVRQDLFAVLENPDEKEGIRAGALLALQRTELDADQARRLEVARREMSRRPTSRP